MPLASAAGANSKQSLISRQAKQSSNPKANNFMGYWHRQPAQYLWRQGIQLGCQLRWFFQGIAVEGGFLLVGIKELWLATLGSSNNIWLIIIILSYAEVCIPYGRYDIWLNLVESILNSSTRHHPAGEFDDVTWLDCSQLPKKKIILFKRSWISLST